MSDMLHDELNATGPFTDENQEISFLLKMKPHSQERPRFAVAGSRAVAYKSAKQREAERELDALLTAYAPKTPITAPVALEIIFGLPVPASDGKMRREAKLSGILRHTKKPDIDNLAKFLLDGMTRCGFWLDDSQVDALHCSKIYTDEPFLRARLRVSWKVKVEL